MKTTYTPRRTPLAQWIIDNWTAHDDVQTECPSCDGKGWLDGICPCCNQPDASADNEKCEDCHGTGWVSIGSLSDNALCEDREDALTVLYYRLVALEDHRLAYFNSGGRITRRKLPSRLHQIRIPAES